MNTPDEPESEFYFRDENPESHSVTSQQDWLFRRIRDELGSTDIEFKGKVEIKRDGQRITRLFLETQNLSDEQIAALATAARQVTNPRPGQLIINNNDSFTDIGTFKRQRA